MEKKRQKNDKIINKNDTYSLPFSTETGIFYDRCIRDVGVVWGSHSIVEDKLNLKYSLQSNNENLPDVKEIVDEMVLGF